MKIAFILEHFHPHLGGAETLLLQIATGLAHAGHAVRVVTSNSGGVSGRHAEQGIEINSVPRNSVFGHPVLRPADVLPIAAWADVIHTATYTAAPLAAWAAHKVGKPCVITVYEALGRKWFEVENNPLLALSFLLFERTVVRRHYTLWHAISEATRRDLIAQKVPSAAIRTVYPGIDERIWHPDVHPRDLAAHLGFRGGDRIFLFSGRPGKPKGLFVLLDAIRRALPRLDETFKFGYIVSDDPMSEKRRLRDLVQHHGLGERVHLSDPVPYGTLPGYRKAAFACVVPSITEGFGFSAVETVYLGVPIVCSDAGSLPEVVGGRVLFHRSRDSADLAEKLVQAAADDFDQLPPRRFSVESAVSGILRLYAEAAGGL